MNTSQAAASAASANYLDPAIRAKHALRANCSKTVPQTPLTCGDIEGAEEVASGKDSAHIRPAGNSAETENKRKVYEGPVVIMSDADNYKDFRKPGRRKAKCGTCSIF